MNIVTALSRPSTLLRATTVAACLVGSVVAAGPASARAIDVADPAHDVQLGSQTQGQDAPTYTPAPRQTNTDLLSARFVHTDRDVVVRERFAELTLRSSTFHSMTVQNANGTVRSVWLFTDTAHPQSTAYVMDSDYTVLSCRASGHIDYAAKTVTIAMARGCLDFPTKVRARSLAYRAAGDHETAYADGTNPAPEKGWTRWIAKG